MTWSTRCAAIERKANQKLLFASFHRMLTAWRRSLFRPTRQFRTHRSARGTLDSRTGRARPLLSRLRSWVGFKQIGIEVERNARYDRQPRVSLRGLFNLAKTAIFSFSAMPLMLFHFIGLAAAAVFLGLGVFSLYCKLFTDLAIPGWTSYILAASFFGAINAMGIAILGEYVIRIYDQVRARPLYLVDRMVNMQTKTRTNSKGDKPYLALLLEAMNLLDAARFLNLDRKMKSPICPK